MGSRGILAVVLLSVLSSASIFKSVDAQKPSQLLFAFGDSYADVGNRAKSGPNLGHGWVYPYGITWPGHPAGRYSDGKTQTDWFADMLGISYPPPYLYSAGQDTSSGVNFAVAGSGVTYDQGQVNLGAQVDNFQLFLRTDPYSKTALANSVTLVSIVGNDYLDFTGKTSAELFVFIETVVSGIQANLQRLYDLGLRNVMVDNLFEVDCLPTFTITNGYKKCTGEYGPWVQIHNSFLLGAVQSLNAHNPGARFIILDQYTAFNRLFNDANKAGFVDDLTPCCAGTSSSTVCGDVDRHGKWLYTVCKHRGKAIFWDNMHPTMWAWNYIINLYAYQPGYILMADAPTLKQWLQITETVPAPVAAPMASPNISSAAGEIEAANNFLLDKQEFSEILGLLQSYPMPEGLSQLPSQVITVFLPTNDGIRATDQGFINRIFAQNTVDNVAVYHAEKGYFDLHALLTNKPASLTSLSGQQVPLAYRPGGIFVGPNRQARVIRPNLYTSPGKLVIHGIDRVLMPPGV